MYTEWVVCIDHGISCLEAMIWHQAPQAALKGRQPDQAPNLAIGASPSTFTAKLSATQTPYKGGNAVYNRC